MKNKKWLTYTLGILLTLIVLAAVGGVGFRVGAMQSASLTRSAFTHDFDGGLQFMQGNSHDREFGNNREGDRRGGDGTSFFSPIFGLIHIALLGLLGWFGYKYVKNSGWRLTRVQATPAPVADETASVDVDEKKESE